MFPLLLTSPKKKYLFLDLFNRANGELTTPWTNAVGKWSVSSNVAKGTSFTENVALAIVTVGLNVEMSANLYPESGKTLVLVIRRPGTTDQAKCFISTSSVILKKVVNSSTTQLWAGAGITSGDKVSFSAKGTLFAIKVNNVVVRQETITDATLQTGTIVGIRIEDGSTVSAVDNFMVKVI
jgi:hypothetical protein